MFLQSAYMYNTVFNMMHMKIIPIRQSTKKQIKSLPNRQMINIINDQQ